MVAVKEISFVNLTYLRKSPCDVDNYFKRVNCNVREYYSNISKSIDVILQFLLITTVTHRRRAGERNTF